jgi:ABC-type molybdate transport system substrate-binding protein
VFTWRLDGYRTLARLTSGSPHRLTPRALSPRLLAVALLLLAPLLAIAAEIKVLSAGAIREPLKELAAQFERATRHKVTIVYGTAGTLRALLEKGESADLLMDAVPGM